MDSTQIKPYQAAKLCQSIRRPLHFIGRLRRRMDMLGFPPDDKLYLSVCRTLDALQELHVLSHYCSCPSGVGR